MLLVAALRLCIKPYFMEYDRTNIIHVPFFFLIEMFYFHFFYRQFTSIIMQMENWAYNILLFSLESLNCYFLNFLISTHWDGLMHCALLARLDLLVQPSVLPYTMVSSWLILTSNWFFSLCLIDQCLALDWFISCWYCIKFLIYDLS